MPLPVYRSSNRLRVCVPTRGRVKSQKSLKMFRLKDATRSGIVRVSFFVPECERVEFRKLYPWAEVETVPDSDMYGNVMQRIADSDDSRKVVLDDDMHLIRRRDPNSISQKDGAATDEDVSELWGRISEWFDKGYVHGGISYRQTNHYCVESFKTNTRVCGLTFFDSDVLAAERVRFDAVQERSDFHVTISLLELGYPNVCDYEFAAGQYQSGTNAPGGCSRYRTPEFLEQQASRLAELHPGVVSLVYKSRKADDVKAMASERGIPDVRVAWAKTIGKRSADRKYVPSPGRNVLVSEGI